MTDETHQKDYKKVGVSLVNYLNYPDTISYIDNYLLKQENVILTIAIVDNNSPNESFNILSQRYVDSKNVHVLQNSSNSGYAAGNNLAVRFLEDFECDFILITNNDIEIYDLHLLDKLTTGYGKKTDAAFVSPVMLRKSEVSREFSAWRLPTRAKEILSSAYFLKLPGYFYLQKFLYRIDVNEYNLLKVDCLSGSFFIGSAKIFRELGYFDENTFLYYEETILGLKVKRIKLQNYLITNLLYSHKVGSSINQSFSLLEKYDELLKSRLYYWKEFHNSSAGFLLILKILHYFHKAELILLEVLRILSGRNRNK